MNKLFVIMSFLILGVSCSSKQAATPKKEVRTVSTKTYEEVSPRGHYSRAISMVEADQGLNPTEKQNLTRVIKEYAEKNRENQKLESKYKSVLVREMLSTGASRNSKAEAAQDELTDLSEKSEKDLQKFIRDFKFHAGDNARVHQSTLLEVINQ